MFQSLSFLFVLVLLRTEQFEGFVSMDAAGQSRCGTAGTTVVRDRPGHRPLLPAGQRTLPTKLLCDAH